MRFSILILLSLIGLSIAHAEVIVIDAPVYRNYVLRGEDGLDGRDGQNAAVKGCVGKRPEVGARGFDGEDGEDGQNGGSIFIQYKDKKDLNDIYLDLRGGMPGKGGLGGLGSQGCNGGVSGENGLPGRVGEHGEYGRIYLIAADKDYSEEHKSRVISIEKIRKKSISLVENNWKITYGAKKIFRKKSKIQNIYYEFSSQTKYEVSLSVSPDLNIYQINAVKLALVLRNKRLVLNSINGPILEYSIHRLGNHFYIDIINFISKTTYSNLELGRLRNHGDKLYLEVLNKYDSNRSYETSFVVGINYVDPITKRESNIGYFPMHGELSGVTGQDYKLFLGKLNFPDYYKKIGTKLKIHVSVYRRYRGQTRVISLRGIFKI